MQEHVDQRLPSLSLLRTFEVVARHGQLKGAADELCLTTSAVSRQIKNLEEQIGVSLFNRERRTIELTETGRRYANDLRVIFDDLFATTQAIRTKSERPALRVHTSMTSFAQRWLLPRLHHFQDRYPTLDIQLTACSEITEVDFSRNSVDIGITRHELLGGALECEPLMPETLVVVCSPSILADRPIECVDDLTGHRIINTTSRPESWSQYLNADNGLSNRAPAELTLAHYFLTLEAAIGGMGVAVLPLPLVFDDIRLGRLVAPLGGGVPSGETYYAIFKREFSQKAEVSKFIAWLKSQASQTLEDSCTD